MQVNAVGQVRQRAVSYTHLIIDALTDGQETLTVTPETAPSAELTGEILSQLVYVAPQSSTVGADGKLTPTVVGHSVDAAEAQAILDQTQPGQTCSIPLIFLQPDLDASEELLYRDKLAESETYMSGPENRRTNIRLAAAAVDGTILMPGETFSYNKIVGERTAAKGYKPATVYVGGLDKQELGGGICQLASALYYCTLSVSYTHLDVYKRQVLHSGPGGYLGHIAALPHGEGGQSQRFIHGRSLLSEGRPYGRSALYPTVFPLPSCLCEHKNARVPAPCQLKPAALPAKRTRGSMAVSYTHL